MVDKQGKQPSDRPSGPQKSDKQVREVALRVIARREKALRELGDR